MLTIAIERIYFYICRITSKGNLKNVTIYKANYLYRWNNSNEMYGEERTIEFLKKNHKDSSKQIMEKLEIDINEFIGDQPLGDDFTIKITKVK